MLTLKELSQNSSKSSASSTFGLESKENMEEVEDPQQKIEEDLTSKTVDELKKLAKERNIEGSSTMKKADLIKALSDNL